MVLYLQLLHQLAELSRVYYGIDAQVIYQVTDNCKQVKWQGHFNTSLENWN